MQKSNRELFLDELSKYSCVDLVDYTNGKLRCLRCSNRYFDGGYNYCHSNINDSNCTEGQIEWLQSYPDDILPLKYNKKYGCCSGYREAKRLQDDLVLLYESGVIDVDCEDYKNNVNVLYHHVRRLKNKLAIQEPLCIYNVSQDNLDLIEVENYIYLELFPKIPDYQCN